MLHCVAEQHFMVAAIAILHVELHSHIPLRIIECVVACRDWLGRSDTMGQLSAAGYNCQPLAQLLDAVSAHHDAATTAVAAAAAVAAPTAGEAKTAVVRVCDLGWKLEALGKALSALPMDWACNNYTCGNLFGLSEQGEVMGRARMCGGCRVARYCSKLCQTEHWKQHKAACKVMAAAQAQQAGTAAS
jgi:hypothetical protein